MCYLDKVVPTFILLCFIFFFQEMPNAPKYIKNRTKYTTNIYPTYIYLTCTWLFFSVQLTNYTFPFTQYIFFEIKASGANLFPSPVGDELTIS